MILIGEMRDAETAQTAIQAAESGHLVLSTLHTVDAAETIGRIVEFFPPEKHQQVRSILAGVLRGVISQRLLPRIDGGRVAAVEVMITNARIADLIRENRVGEIEDAIADGAYFKMQTFTQALIDARPRRRSSTRRRPRTRPATATTSSSRSTAPSRSGRRRSAGLPRSRGHRPPGRPAHRAAGGTVKRLVVPLLVGLLACRRGRARGDGRPSPSCRARPRCRARRARRTAATSSLAPDLDVPARPARPALLRPAAPAVAERRPVVRHPLERARRDQQDRVELRPEHGPELRRRDRLDAVHAVDLDALGNRRGRRTASPIRGTRSTPSTRPPATSPRRAARADIRRAVFSYNHADWYVNEVLQLAQLYGSSDRRRGRRVPEPPAVQRPVFALDRLQAELDDARAAVTRASDAYRAALDAGPGTRRRARRA